MRSFLIFVNLNVVSMTASPQERPQRHEGCLGNGHDLGEAGGKEMLAHEHFGILAWSKKGPIIPVFSALAIMLLSAYSIVRYVGAVGAIGGWMGRPQYVDAIQAVQRQATWWGWLAIILPFFAALLLCWKAKQSATSPQPSVLSYPAETRRWTRPIERYLVGLAIAVLGTLGFTLCLFLVAFLFYKLGIRSN